MVTRNDIINILNQHESREEKKQAVEAHLIKNVLTVEDRLKILDDLESYENY